MLLPTGRETGRHSNPRLAGGYSTTVMPVSIRSIGGAASVFICPFQ
ncbi:MAG: hypothetical protein NWR11_06315 [Cyanobium sp. MAG_137]|nr:hypothetical protein [Cyanobium sp. MAG_137]MDP4948137.1 hypothetical protein [Cyanobium sp. MAG_102]